MTRSTLALAFLSFAAVPFCACVASDTPPQVQTYREVDGQTLAAHVFAPADNDGETARPAILLFHGGGWSVGSPTWTFSAARRFAGHGMVAIAVQYRLADDQTTPIDAFADVCAAFRWARSQATSLNLDTDRVVGYGVSAGGHLVSSTVTVGCPAVWEGAPAAEPNALLLWSPALDIARDGWFERKLLGRAPALDYSPLEHVGAATPPTSIVQGDADTLTPLAGAQAFCQRLREHDTCCDLNVYPGVGHLLTRNLEQQERDFDPDPDAVDNGIAQHLRFLRDVGYIDSASPAQE